MNVYPSLWWSIYLRGLLSAASVVYMFFTVLYHVHALDQGIMWFYGGL
jgi:hypothetical protein